MQNDRTHEEYICCVIFKLISVMSRREINRDWELAGEIADKIWVFFDLLRSVRIAPENYHVILFLTSLYRDNIFDEELIDSQENILSGIENRIYNGNFSCNDVYREIFPLYKDVLHYLGDAGLIEMYTIIGGAVPSEFLDEIYPEVFDTLLYKITSSTGKSGGSILPVEVSQLIFSICDIPENSVIYNPFAGMASFGVFKPHGAFYTGQEINKVAWAIGHLRILAYDLEFDSSFHVGNSITDWNPFNKKYDYIIADPPFNLPLNKPYEGDFGKIHQAEPFVIEKGIKDLKQDGKLIVVFPQNFLFRSGTEKKLRQFLVDNDLLELVVSLPGGILLNTGISCVILVINKNKPVKEKVKFIDAQKYFIQTTSKEKKLDVKVLSSIISDSEHHDVRVASNSEIRELEYNLSVPRYFQTDFPGEKLSEYCTIISGNRIKKTTDLSTGKLVKISDLKSDNINFHLEDDKVSVVELKGSVFKIEQSCLLLATRWKSIKPTYFTYIGDPIYITNDIVALDIDDTKVEIGYLVNEFHDQDVLRQIEALRLGDVMPRLSHSDLLNVKVFVPSIQEQRNMYSKYLIADKKLKDAEFERNALAFGLRKEHFDEFASLKHTLGAPRQNILSYAETLISFFENNSSSSVSDVNDIFKDTFGVDLIQVFQSIKQDVNFISEILEKGEGGLVLSNYELEKTSLNLVEKELKKFVNTPAKFNLRIKSLKDYNKTAQGILSNKTLIKVLFDNILTNAEKYGFDQQQPENEVLIDLRIIDDNLIVDIKNNGNPFPAGYDKEKFIKKYSTADSAKGQGIGGYDINRIIEYQNGSWDLILNEDKIYPVWFKIQFPLIPII